MTYKKVFYYINENNPNLTDDIKFLILAAFNENGFKFENFDELEIVLNRKMMKYFNEFNNEKLAFNKLDNEYGRLLSYYHRIYGILSENDLIKTL